MSRATTFGRGSRLQPLKVTGCLRSLCTACLVAVAALGCRPPGGEVKQQPNDRPAPRDDARAGDGGDNAEPARLAVLVMVDMLTASHFPDWAEYFGDGGFKRLMQDGAWFTNAHFSFGATITAPGHATLVSGATPSGHGIVGNQWYDPSWEKVMASVAEPLAYPLGLAPGTTAMGSAPARLEADTLGDSLKRHHGDAAKVWSFSIKARAAVLLGGRRADGALWWDNDTGYFVSSTHYYEEMPYWMEDLNNIRYGDRFFHSQWERALPEGAYAKCAADDAPYETGTSVLFTNTLPKRLGGILPEPNRIFWAQLQCSPFGNELVLEPARRAVVEESLGQYAGNTDLLAISLSSVDYVGHSFGPDSHEMLDMVVRTDRQLADWLEFLDEHVGLEHCLIVVAGDHGVGPAPELVQARGLDAGRIDLRDLYRFLNDRLVEQYGEPGGERRYVAALDPPWVTLDAKLMERSGVPLDEAVEYVRQAAAGYAGIASAFVAQDVLAKPPSSRTPLERAIANSAYPDRSGHVYVHFKKYWARTRVCASHGTAHEYDTHVPLMLMGPGVAPGRCDKRVEMRDAAPTIARLLRIEPPADATGRVLESAIAR